MSEVLEPAAPAPTPPRRPRVARYVALAAAAVLALFVVVAARGDGGTDETAETPLLGQPAPPLTSTTIDGEPFDLAQRRGSWVVLNFFSTECPPCVREHPELVRFARSQQAVPGGAELYTVVNNDEPDDVRAFFAGNGGGWPVLTDPDGRTSVAFGVAKVPETWIVDPDGVVRARVISTVTADGLAQLLREQQAGRPT